MLVDMRMHLGTAMSHRERVGREAPPSVGVGLAPGGLKGGDTRLVDRFPLSPLVFPTHRSLSHWLGLSHLSALPSHSILISPLSL